MPKGKPDYNWTNYCNRVKPDTRPRVKIYNQINSVRPKRVIKVGSKENSKKENINLALKIAREFENSVIVI